MEKHEEGERTEDQLEWEETNSNYRDPAENDKDTEEILDGKMMGGDEVECVELYRNFNRDKNTDFWFVLPVFVDTTWF